MTALVHVEAALAVPTDDGHPLTIRQGIGAYPTATPGLVTFPALIGPFEYDDTRWHVTHAATGRYLPITFPDQAHATAFAAAVGPLADWTVSRPVPDRAALLRLGVEHGGTPDQHVTEHLAHSDNTPKEN